MSKWSHLANAKHIDRIIAHVKANPEARAARAATREMAAARDAAWLARRAASAAMSAARSAAWSAALPGIGRSTAAAWAAWVARDAISALVAWDHAGGLIDLPADQVKVLAILGDQAAILMYPAIAAMETTRELA